MIYERKKQNEKIICKRAYERQNRRGNKSKYCTILKADQMENGEVKNIVLFEEID